MTTHPHGEQLSAYLDGMLDTWQMRQVAQHLGACAQCRALQNSLRQTKMLLREIAPPETPGADFWVNTYRRLRVEGETRPSWKASLRETLSAGLPSAQRRWAAGAAAAAVIGAAIAGPLLTHSINSHPTSPGTIASATDSVDISSLVRAHTESAAYQPLGDPDRQAMINADTDDGIGFNDVAAEATGDGGSFAADAAH